MAKYPIRWEIWTARPENDGIKNEILVNKTDRTDDHDSKRRAENVFAQFGYMVEKRHFAALVFQALMFVQLILWHAKGRYGAA